MAGEHRSSVVTLLFAVPSCYSLLKQHLGQAGDAFYCCWVPHRFAVICATSEVGKVKEFSHSKADHSRGSRLCCYLVCHLHPPQRFLQIPVGVVGP